VVTTDHGAIASVLDPVDDAPELPFDPDSVGSVDRGGGPAAPDPVVDALLDSFREGSDRDPVDAAALSSDGSHAGRNRRA
jgi:hypothetical protein